VEKLAPVLVKVKPANSEGEERVVHSSRLRLYQGKDGRSKILPQPLYVDEEEDDEPNVIRAAPGADPRGSAAAAAAATAPAWIPTGAAPSPILGPTVPNPPVSNPPVSNPPVPQPPAFNPPAQMDVEVTDEVVREDNREVTMEDVENSAREDRINPNMRDTDDEGIGPVIPNPASAEAARGQLGGNQTEHVFPRPNPRIRRTSGGNRRNRKFEVPRRMFTAARNLLGSDSSLLGSDSSDETDGGPGGVNALPAGRAVKAGVSPDSDDVINEGEERAAQTQ